MSLISLNVRFQGQPGPHLLAVSFSQVGPKGDMCDLGQRVAPTAQAFDSVTRGGPGMGLASPKGTNGEACGLRLWRVRNDPAVQDHGHFLPRTIGGAP
jgi:hypothetical protein